MCIKADSLALVELERSWCRSTCANLIRTTIKKYMQTENQLVWISQHHPVSQTELHMEELRHDSAALRLFHIFPGERD